MRIVSLAARGFRNLHGFRIEPCERLTVVVGENGQGKTNLLEAIYYVATLKPLRAAKLEELVAFGHSSCEIVAVVREDIDRELSVRIEGGKRSATLEGKKPRSIEAYGEVLKVVAFTPDDLQLVKGSGSMRRRWLDRAAFTRRGVYAREYRDFERALKGRNRLLKMAKESGRVPSELDVFDEALARTGSRIRSRRMDVLSELFESARERFEGIARLGRELSIHYQTGSEGAGGRINKCQTSGEEVEASLLSALQERRRVDLARGHSTVGPQVDDVSFTIEDKEARTFASQGQQRALVLALKIAEIENLGDKLGRTPILLLDDVSSELDPIRNEHLIDYLSSFTGQAMVSTTDPDLAPASSCSKTGRLRVSAGRLLGGEGTKSVEIPSENEGF